MTLINWIIKQIKKYNDLSKKYANDDACGPCCNALDGGADCKGNG